MRLIKIGIVSSLMLIHPLAWSCADESCVIGESDCAIEGLPFLSPDNDTRVNLLLLASEQNPALLPSSTPLPANSLDSPLNGYGLLNYNYRQTVYPTLDAELAKSLLADDVLIAQAQAKTVQDGRCVSNNAGAANQFMTALAADNALSPPQRSALANARLKLVGLCGSDVKSDLTAIVSDKNSEPFINYLNAASSFYFGEFRSANMLFNQLTQTSQPWVKEAATYMQARVAINQSQLDAVDQYGFFERAKVNNALLQQAKQALDNYLALYPQGSYAESANGLYRRVYWMQSNDDLLAQQYHPLLNQIKDAKSLVILAIEIDDKLLEDKKFTSNDHAPMLTLIQDLKRLRTNLYDWQPLSADEIKQQQDMFVNSNHSEWFDYLVNANNLYKNKDYAAVITAIRPLVDNERLTPLVFSRQVLRGLALGSLKQFNEAETHWRNMLLHSPTYEQQQYLQLALAMNLSGNGKLSAIFASDSPVTALRYRLPLLMHIAPAKLLREQATNKSVLIEERRVALFTLLFKELSSGQYSAYLSDIKYLNELTDAGKTRENQPWLLSSMNPAIFNWDGSKTTAGYRCPSLTNVVEKLNKNSKDPSALNCLGEFFFTSDIEYSVINYPNLSPLTKRPTEFSGQLKTRLDFYQQVMKDPKASDDEITYALYRAIHCFQPSGRNQCGSQDISIQQRKAWFNTLKSKYKQSGWAKKSQYYW